MSDRSIQLAKNRAWPLLERLNTALEAGAIDDAQWYEQIAAVIVPAYLAGEDPRAQSGSSGDEEDWTYKRSLIAEAIDREGTFLDVGCASGYLMETLTRWCEERGHTIEPYGLDIAPALADLARRRLPHWARRIFVGNAIDWTPPHPFTYVRTGLEYVPPGRQRALVEHLLGEVVAPGGRLIIGTYSEERAHLRTEAADEDRVAQWGFTIAGRAARPHRQDPRLAYHVFWIARSADPPLDHRS